MRILVLCLSLAACDSRTSALIDIEGVMPLSSLDLTISIPGRNSLKQPLGAITPPRSLLIILPDAMQTVQLTLAGVEQGGRSVGAQASFQSKPHQQVALTMSLAGPGDDLSMPMDLAGVDLTGFIEDLANADLTPAPGDLAGADFSLVPSLSIVAGLPGGLNTYDAVGRDARLAVPEQPALVGTSLYFFEIYTGRLRKVEVTTGAVTSVPLTKASDSSPYFASEPVGLVSDGQGHLYFSNFYDHTIRMVDLVSLKVSLIAGAELTPGSTDSPPRFNNPEGLALDANGDLWVADTGNFTIRKIALAGPTVTTPAGTPGMNDFTDGAGASGHFKNPQGLAFYNGDLYVTDDQGLRKVVVTASPSPAPVSTVISEGTWAGVLGVASAGGGTLYVVEQGENDLRSVTLGPPVSQMTVAGKALFTQDFVDGIGGAARFVDPHWLVLDGAGAAYLTESGAVRKIDLGNFNVTTLAGTSPSSDNTDSPRARFNGPTGIAFDGSDTLYVADYSDNRIRKLTLSTGNLVTFAGNGAYASTDGTGLTASFYSPIGIAGDGQGNFYVSDFQGHCIRKLSPGADVVTIAGVPGMSGPPSPSPVPGAQATFQNPDGLAFDGDHTLWVADGGNNALRAIDLTNNVVSWVAGSGSSGDIPGVGRAARFADPLNLAYDSAAKILYVSDNGSGVIRTVDMTNPALPNVTDLAGVPFASSFMDGDFSVATFNDPGGLALDVTRHVLWVADNGYDLVRKLDLMSRTVSSPIGTPNALFTKPGPLPAFLARPWGVALTPKGIVVSSWDENTILLATGL